MAEGEARIKIKISQEGKKVLDDVDESFEEMIGFAQKAALGIAAVGAAMVKMALDAGEFNEVKNAFSSMAEQQGKDGKEMLKNLKEITAGTVSEVELMKQANAAMMAGIPIDRFDEIMAIAKNAADATGESLESMVASMVNGINKQSKLMLTNTGILIDAEQANLDYAKSLGKTVEQLTDAEKKQVFMNEALRIGNENLAKLGESAESTNDKWDRMKAALTDTSVAMGQLMVPVVNQLMDGFNGLLLASGDIAKNDFLVGAFRTTAHVINDVSAAFSVLFDYAKTFPDIAKAAASGAVGLAQIFAFDVEGGKKSIEESKAMFGKAIDDLSARRKASHESWAEDQKAIDTAYNDWATETTDTKREEKKTKDIQAKQETAVAVAAIEDEEGARRVRQLVSFRDNEKALAEQAATDEAARLAKQLEDEKAAKLKAMDEEYLARVDMGNKVFQFTSGGLENVTKQALILMTDSFLPGFGAAAGEIFSVLAQDSEEFKKQLDQMLSVDFIDNFGKNLITLFDELPGKVDDIVTYLAENAPDLIKGMIEAIIAAMPEIVSAFAKAFINTMGDPEFHRKMVEAIVNGIVAGVKDAAGDIAEAVKKGINDAIGWLNPGGGGGDDKDDDKPWWQLWNHGNIFDGQIPRFAAGGIVDNTLAMVTPGEAVINRDSTAANAGLLSAINQSNGRAVSAGNSIVINVNGGLLGDDSTARQFARAIDEQLYKLRLGRESRAFDDGVV